MRGCTESTLRFFSPKIPRHGRYKFKVDSAFLVYASFSGVIERKKWSEWGETEREFDSLRELPLINTCMWDVVCILHIIHMQMYKVDMHFKITEHDSTWLHGFWLPREYHPHPADHSHGPICIPSCYETRQVSVDHLPTPDMYHHILPSMASVCI